MFNYLITYSIGRFDSPGIFIIQDIKGKKFYRNYEIYDGTANFRRISEDLISGFNNGTKIPLYAYWIDSYKNLMNFEHWNNNRLKAYMYAIGLVTVAVLPWIVLVDFFFPIFGRGPNSHPKKRHHDDKKVGQEQGKPSKDTRAKEKDKNE
jgi:hypothetical protein